MISIFKRHEHYIFAIGTGIFLVLHVLTYKLDLGPQWVANALGIAAIVVGSYPILKDILINIRSLKINVDMLVAIAVIAATAVGHYFEAGTVLFIHILGELLEHITVGRAKRTLHSLMSLMPETAQIKKNGIEKKVSVDEVKKGDIIIIRPGERIGVDGIVMKGYAAVDQAAITGESIPVDKKVGDPVYSGTLNKTGSIDIKATKVGGESTVARIKEIMKRAEKEKAPAQRLADRFASWYVPIILSVAVIIYFVTGDILRSITLLIISCPCALILGPPTAIISAISNAARRGILIKSGAALEKAGRLNTIIFDKTGTLTKGRSRVVDIKSFNCQVGHEKEDMLLCAAVSEKLSEHPIGKAVTYKANKMGMSVPEPDEFSMYPGMGVRVKHNELEIFTGSREHMLHGGVPISSEVEDYAINHETKGETVLLMGHIDGERAEVCGAVSVADTLRDDALEAVKKLKTMDIQLAVNTGDNTRTAQAIADSVGIKKVSAELLPEEKVDSVRSLQAEGKCVGMVGDGINDAPAMTAADVGFAMGAIGTDLTVEASDIALMSDNLSNVPNAIKIGRAVLRTIRQDIFFALIFNIAGLVLASTGSISMIAGAVLHQASSLVVVLNSMRMLIYRPEGSK